MGSPVQSDSGGIKLKPENMEVDRLYHCIHEGKVFLFYKDKQDILHCYEVEDLSALEEISENPDCIEKILRKYAGCD
jgi:hypothetical protein